MDIYTIIERGGLAQEQARAATEILKKNVLDRRSSASYLVRNRHCASGQTDSLWTLPQNSTAGVMAMDWLISPI